MSATDNLTVHALSDTGMKRKHNEDTFLVDESLGLFVVADGMGGHAAGEVASALAVETIHAVIVSKQEAIADFAQRGPESSVSLGELLGILEHAIQEASRRIHAQAQRERKQRGMGTTCSLLLLLGNSAYVAHVGDSRVYMVRDGVAQQITDDHTIANELIKAGIVSADQIHLVPRRNAITRAVGVYEHVEVDTLTLEVLPGDQFVLCSDGLAGYLDDHDRDLVDMLPEDGDTAVKELIDFANASGGKDNTTAVLVRLATTREERDTQRAARIQLKRDTLTGMALFSRLDDRELLRVMQVAQVASYAAHEIVVEEGDAGDRMFVALTGSLEVVKGAAVLSTLGPGDHFGEMSLIRERPRSATVRALEDSDVLSIRRDDFFDLLRHEHRLGVKLLWQFVGVLANRLERTSHNLSEARGEVTDRIAVIIDDEPSLDPFSGPASPRPSLLPRPRTLPGIDFDAEELSPFDAPVGRPEKPVLPTPRGQAPIQGGPLQTVGPSFEDAPALAVRLPKQRRDPDAALARDDEDPITQPRPPVDPSQSPPAGDDVPFDEKKTLPSRDRRETMKSAAPVFRAHHTTIPDGQLRAARDEALQKAPGDFVPTKKTVPLEPSDELREELADLRAEFKRRLAEARRQRTDEEGE